MIQSIEQRIAGISLIFVGGLIVFIMMHHPSHFDAPVLNAWVHGSMIGVILLATIGVTYWGICSPQSQLLRISGTLLFVLGSFLNVFAAAINGFIVPEMLERFGEDFSRDLHGFAWAFNQTMARIAVVVHAIAMLVFSLQSSRSQSPKIEGTFRAVGGIAGIVTVGILIVHRGSMDVHTALAIYSLEAIWIVTLGVFLVSAKVNCRSDQP